MRSIHKLFPSQVPPDLSNAPVFAYKHTRRSLFLSLPLTHSHCVLIFCSFNFGSILYIPSPSVIANSLFVSSIHGSHGLPHNHSGNHAPIIPLMLLPRKKNNAIHCAHVQCTQFCLVFFGFVVELFRRPFNMHTLLRMPFLPMERFSM